MKTDKTKLLQDIKAMKEKLASMEEELNKPEEFKHFPSKGDSYYSYSSYGIVNHYYYSSYGIVNNYCMPDNDTIINAYKTHKEAQEAYNKAVALEKIKRRLLELQGDWKPNWEDEGEKKVHILHCHLSDRFDIEVVHFSQIYQDLPYIKSIEMARTIIEEMEEELKLIFDIV